MHKFLWHFYGTHPQVSKPGISKTECLTFDKETREIKKKRKANVASVAVMMH